MTKHFFFFPLMLSASLTGSSFGDVNPARLSSLYHSLDPVSIVQNLSFYELYPETAEGKLALQKAWDLLHEEGTDKAACPLTLPKLDLQAIISLVTKQPSDTPKELSEQQLEIMSSMGAKLHNRSLKGFQVWTQKEVLALEPEEIDLSRALFICQFEDEPDYKKKILQYEASLDLMALQIKRRLSPNATAEEMIHKINSFIFQEMGFRFPPHSVHIKDIDLYTFLPSVLDSRLGVCLGVSILYLCIAQRLNLPLEIITPPGHIYLRHPSQEGPLNIETTARGIHLPSDVYLGINTRRLENRNIKQAIGWSFINQASVSWGKEDYQTTVKIYEKALPYLPDDPLLQMFLGLNYLFVGKKKEGKKLLESLNPLFDFAVSAETIPSDYLKGLVDIEGLKVVFSRVDEHRSSILEKQQELKKVVKKFPKFKAGIMQLAITHLQLGHTAEALDILTNYHAIDPTDATVEYYLAALCFERLDYLKAWKYCKKAEKLTRQRGHYPKALKALKAELNKHCPDPVS